nr:hypothetical protein [Tanacetum cinerariifolium]
MCFSDFPACFQTFKTLCLLNYVLMIRHDYDITSSLRRGALHMHRDQAQQATSDEKLVPSDDRVKIGSSNLRLDPTFTQKEKTYQQFWFTITKVKKSSFYKFDLDNKKCQINVELFREILGIFLRVTNQEFTVPPSNDSLIDFLMELRYKAYKTFITLSISLIPPKKGRGNGAYGTEAIVIPKKATTAPKKKLPKKRVSHKQSSITADDNILQDPDEALKLGKSMNHKVNQHIGQLAEGSPEELPSEALHKEIKDNKRESIFQHQSGGSSEGAGITPEVLDESTGKSTVSNEGAGISPKVLDEAKHKSEAQADEDEWGSTNDETLLFDDKDEQVEEITWVSTDNDEEDDESINIENINDERTKSYNDDHEMIDAVKTDVEKEHEENAKNVKEQKANEEQKTDEEQKGDDQVEDGQVWVPSSFKAIGWL